MLERHDAASLILDLFLTGARSIEHGVTGELENARLQIAGGKELPRQR